MKNQIRLVLALIAVSAITSCQKESSSKPAIQYGSGGADVKADITRPIIKTYTLPTSDAFIGIRWKSDDDLDLIIIDSVTGQRLQKFSYNNEVEYSGDQQTGYGVPGFAGRELFYASTYFRPALIKVKYNNGANNFVNFNFYTGQEHITNFTGNYEVQTSSIKYDYDETPISPIGALVTVAYISGGKLYIYK